MNGKERYGLVSGAAEVSFQRVHSDLQVSITLELLVDLLAGVLNGCVVSTEDPPDFGEGMPGMLAHEPHCDVSRPNQLFESSISFHVDDFDVVEIRDRLDDVLDRDSPAIGGQHGAQVFLGEINRWTGTV